MKKLKLILFIISLTCLGRIQAYESINSSRGNAIESSGANTNANFFYSRNNPNLNCVQADDVAYSTANCTNIDEHTQFNQTYVPDDNFEQALIDLGYDTAPLDNYVPTGNIININYLNVSNKGISDLTGIESFTSLTALSCHSNNLTSLDISNNSTLISLNCHSNSLTGLDVSNNTALTELYSFGNNLTSLDVSNNTALTSLSCHTNNLTNLDVSSNTALTLLYCNANQNLSCIQVNDIAAANNNFNWVKDTIATYSLICELKTYVPNNNFEQALIDLGYDSGPLNNYVPTANINNITSLNVSNKNISDLTGIEDFTALTVLNCDSNSLTSIDISSNTALTTLYCSINNLTSLDVSNNTALTELYSFINNLTSLDVSNNTALIRLYCGKNSLTNLDVSSNTDLTYLSCHTNSLTSLDVSSNTVLTTLKCHSNSLTSLDVSNNTALTYLHCNSNPSLSCIQVNNVAAANNNFNWVKDTTTTYSLNCELTYVPDNNFEQALIDLGYDSGPLDNYVTTANINDITLLYVSNKNISDLTGIEDFTALTSLNCHSNNLTSIDISNNTALTHLSFYSNNLTSIDISNNTALTYLDCYSNDFTSLDVSSNIALTYLDCDSNSLTSLDVSNNIALIRLYCDSNSLTNLDISSNTALTRLDCNSNSLTSLDASNNTALIRLDCNSNSLTSLDVSSNTALVVLSCDSNPILSCIQVNDVAAANNNSNWVKDATAVYNLNCSTLSIEEDTLINVSAIKFYPNPTKAEVNIEGISDLETVTLYNTSGQLVRIFNSNLNTIDLSGIQSGVYFAKVQAKSGTTTLRLVKE